MKWVRVRKVWRERRFMLISKGDHFNDDELAAVRVKRGNEIACVIILWVSYYVFITD